MDLQFLVSSTIRDISTSSCEVIRRNAVYEYYEKNDIDVGEVIEESIVELEDIFTRDVHRLTTTKNYDGLNVSLHRMLGVARYLFADKLIATCGAYIDVLQKARSCSVPIKGSSLDVLVVSLNMLLREILSEFQRTAKSMVKKGGADDGDVDFYSMGMMRQASDSFDTNTTTGGSSVGSYRK